MERVPTLRLRSSTSEQNVYLTYVCTVHDVNPLNNQSEEYGKKSSPHVINPGVNELEQEEPIQVERTKALHELLDSNKGFGIAEDNLADNHKTDPTSLYPATTSGEESDHSEYDEFLGFDNPNVLKLTKMKWLSEDQDRRSLESSSPSISPVRSTTSTCSHNSDGPCCCTLSTSFEEKCLSTILRLDKEHNLFGLSNIAIVGSKTSKKMPDKTQDDRAVFHQTAIVQLCCASKCCRHMTKSDLPVSLKCGSCWGCGNCQGCSLSAPCPPPPCSVAPSCCSFPKKKKSSCCPSALTCLKDGTAQFGLTVFIKKKPKYDPPQVELTPKSSCILSKPILARECTHVPRCVPPSSCFPFLMPCYWPSRPSAPCSVGARCFHNPPCLPPRKKKSYIPPEELCKPPCTSTGEKDKEKCENWNCPGPTTNNTCFQNAPSRDSLCEEKKKKESKVKVECECSTPICARCFVTRPKVSKNVSQNQCADQNR